MVRAAMAERQLCRLVACRKPHQLVAEADAEHRHAAERLADDPRLLDERRRVARAVREQDAVVGGEIVRIADVRVDRDRCAGRREPAQDRALEAVVDTATPTSPSSLNRYGAGVETSATSACALHERLRPHLLERVGDGDRLSSATTTPRIAPRARRRSVSARVSISSRATIPRSASQSAQSSPPRRRIRTARACGVSDSSRESATP